MAKSPRMKVPAMKIAPADGDEDEGGKRKQSALEAFTTELG